MSATDSKLQSVQFLRGLAALSVLIGHAQAEAVQMSAGAFQRIPFAWGGGVDVFFVISGFVMILTTHSHWSAPGSSGTFLLKRIFRVVPLYWVYSALMIAALLLFAAQLNSSVLEWDNVALSFVFIPDARLDGTIRPLLALGWTINYEMFFYTLFAVCLLFPRRLGLGLLVGGLALLAGIGALVSFDSAPLEFWTDPIILEFLLGVLLGLAHVSGATKRNPVLLVVVAALSITLYAFGYPLMDAQPQLRWLVLGVPAAGLCYCLVWGGSPAGNRVVRFVGKWLGDSSYSLYLSHPFSLALVKMLWPDGAQTALSLWLYVLASCVAAILGAIVSYQLLERPLQHYVGKRIRWRTRPKVAAQPAFDGAGGRH